MVNYGSKEYNGTLTDMINFSRNAQKLVGNTLVLNQNKTLYIQAMLKNSSEISDAIFAGDTSLSKVITCNYPQNPTSPLDEANINPPLSANQSLKNSPIHRKTKETKPTMNAYRVSDAQPRGMMHKQNLMRTRCSILAWCSSLLFLGEWTFTRSPIDI